VAKLGVLRELRMAAAFASAHVLAREHDPARARAGCRTFSMSTSSLIIEPSRRGNTNSEGETSIA